MGRLWHLFWLNYIYQILKKYLLDISLNKFFYYRYVDDIFLVIPADVSKMELLNYLNSLDPHLKFTMKTEIQEKLHFLDVSIRRKNNKIVTIWYRKSSNTLNFN